MVAALAALTPGQFLVLSLVMTASVLSGSPSLAQTRILGFTSRIVASLIWCASWCATPNAVAEWVLTPDFWHIIKRSSTLLSLFIQPSKPKVPSPTGIVWDPYSVFLTTFSLMLALPKVSLVFYGWLSTPAPVVLIDDLHFLAPPCGRLPPLTAQNLNTLCIYLQRAALLLSFTGA